MKLGLKLLLAALILLGLMSVLALLAGWLWYAVIAVAIVGGIALAISWGKSEKASVQSVSARTEAKQESAALKELRTLEKEQERQEKLTRRRQ